MNRNFIVKPIVTAMSPIEYERMYGVFEYVEDIGIHTKDEYSDLIVLTYSELIAEKIRELLEADEFMHDNKSNFKED